MRHQRLSRVHLLLTASLTSLMFSARLAWTQEGPSAGKATTQVSLLAPLFVGDPEAGIRFRPVCQNLTSPFASSQGQAPSLVRFHSLDLGYPFALTQNSTLPDLGQAAETGETQVKANHFISNAPTAWLTNGPPHNTLQYRAPDSDDELQRYGHYLPGAGRIILSMSKQAKFHPRVFRVLELMSPGVSLQRLHRTRWISR